MTVGLTVIDGGMGKELRRIGAPFRQPEWSALALMTESEWVLEAHENFIDAGAELITTNSYAIVPFHIGWDEFDQRGAELAELAGTLAREAADDADRPVLVAGSLPPLFGSYRPDLFDVEVATDLLDVLISGLSPSVDLWLAETLGSVAEFETIIDGLARHVTSGGESLELWASFSLDDSLVDGQVVLRSGESLEALVTAVSKAQAAGTCDALLFNCSQPETISTALGELHHLLGDNQLRLGAYANAFPGHDDDQAADSEHLAANSYIHEPRADLTPERYATMVQGWIDEGVTIVGGCCDIGPEHIAALATLAGQPAR